MPLQDSSTSLTREANRALNIAEFERAAVTLRSRPRVLFIELTENCNLSCSMCRSAGSFDRTKNMDRKLFEAVAAELFPTAELVDLRGWGESTILRQFSEYVETTLDYGCRIRLVTNLTVSNESLWRRLVRAGSLIAVSLDTADEAVLNQLRRGAKLPVILRNLEILADETRAAGADPANIHLNVVVQAAALDGLHEIVRLAARLGFGIQMNPVTLDESDPDDLRHHYPAVAEALARTAAEAKRLNVDARLGSSLAEMWAAPEHAGTLCTHPWMYCYVNYRGQVGFCDHLIGEPDRGYLLGDLTAEHFDAIWNGAAYRDLRSQHGRWQEGIGERFGACNWCYRNRYVDFEEVTYPPYARHIVNLSPGMCVAPAESTGEGARRLLPIVSAPSGCCHRDG